MQIYTYFNTYIKLEGFEFECLTLRVVLKERLILDYLKLVRQSELSLF